MKPLRRLVRCVRVSSLPAGEVLPVFLAGGRQQAVQAGARDGVHRRPERSRVDVSVRVHLDVANYVDQHVEREAWLGQFETREKSGPAALGEGEDSLHLLAADAVEVALDGVGEDGGRDIGR